MVVRSLTNSCSRRPETIPREKKKPSNQRKEEGWDERQRVIRIPRSDSSPEQKKRRESQKRENLCYQSRLWFLISCNYYCSMCPPIDLLQPPNHRTSHQPVRVGDEEIVAHPKYLVTDYSTEDVLMYHKYCTSLFPSFVNYAQAVLSPRAYR